MGERGTITSKEDFAEEAKYFTESRLLHREVEIILESQSNNNFIGSVLHPVSFWEKFPFCDRRRQPKFNGGGAVLGGGVPPHLPHAEVWVEG